MKRVLLPSELQAIPDLTAAIKLGHFAPAYPCKIIRNTKLIRREPAFLEAQYQFQPVQVQEQEQEQTQQTQERTQEQPQEQTIQDMSFI